MNKILCHRNTTYINLDEDFAKKDLTSDNIEYVYSAYLDNHILCAVIVTKSKNYYVIKNTTIAEDDDDDENGIDEDAKILPFDERFEKNATTITHSPNLKQCVNSLSSQLRKYLQIKKTSKMTFKKKDKDILDNKHTVIPTDYLFQTSEDVKYLWVKNLINSQDRLDLTDNFTITANDIENYTYSKISQLSKIKRIILHQNEQITDFAWLRLFNNLEQLIITYSLIISNKHIEQIMSVCPNLKSLQLTNVLSLDAEVFMSVLKHKELRHLTIDDPQFKCVHNQYKPIIEQDSWIDLYNDTLTELYITSQTLTNEFLTFLNDTCPALKRLKVTDEVFEGYIKPFFIEGFDDDDFLEIRSVPSNAYIRYKRPIRVKTFNRYANKEPISENMKKIIEAQQRETGIAVHIVK